MAPQIATATTLTLPSDTEILIVRSFHAPRALVWRAFTDPELVPRWYGPADHPMTRCEMDLRPGGKFLWAWGEHTMPGVFKEVAAPRRLVYEDTGGTPSLVTVTFTEEKDGRTKVAMHARMPSKAARDEILASGWSEGMEACYVRLDALLPEAARPRGPASTLTLPSDTEIRIERSFRAPRDLVWRAFTDASLLPKWMGPAKYAMTRSEMDLRPGGQYHWVWRVDGSDLYLHGVFLEVDAPRRLVTEEYMDPFPTPSHNTMTFTEKDGRTMVALVIKVPTREIRDMMLATGMQAGMDEGYARLDALLPGLA